MKKIISSPTGISVVSGIVAMPLVLIDDNAKTNEVIKTLKINY